MQGPEVPTVSPVDLVTADELIERQASALPDNLLFIRQELEQAAITGALVELDEAQHDHLAYNIHLPDKTPDNVLIELGKRIKHVLNEHQQIVSLQFYNQGHRIFIP